MPIDWQFAKSSPDMNIEGRWVFMYLQNIWDEKVHRIRTKTFYFYTLGMDGVEQWQQ